MLNEQLQTDKPLLPFEDWFLEVTKLFAEAWGVDAPTATRRLNMFELEEWHKDGFTPQCVFRENYKPLY